VKTSGGDCNRLYMPARMHTDAMPMPKCIFRFRYIEKKATHADRAYLDVAQPRTLIVLRALWVVP
jgi:hypothetical protein